MFNKSRLKEILIQYKKDFLPKHWEDEKYKWEAIKCFQDNWNVDAADFADMLAKSLAETDNLLTSMNNFPKGMIIDFAKNAPEEVRAMYMDLFDESKEVYDRINVFKTKSASLLEKYGNEAKQHYQHENAITVYLWLRYPEKYYIYKFGEVKAVSDVLESGYRFKKGSYRDNIRNFYEFYNEICEELRQDTELVELFRNHLTDTCYPDPELKTLTFDVGFYISRHYSKGGDSEDAGTENDGWWPNTSEYDPGLTTQDWVTLLQDKNVFNEHCLQIMKRIKECGGEASCTQLSCKYGESKNFYNANSSALARRVSEKTGCMLPPDRDSRDAKWWPILYVGKYASKKVKSEYIWKLRDPLSKALDQVDLSDVDLYAKNDDEKAEPSYWWMNASPKIWSFSDLSVGEVEAYTLYNENGHKRRIFQNFIDAKAGDLVIGYEANPVKQIVALVRVKEENDGKKIFFEKTEGLSSPIDYQTLKACPELKDMEFFRNPNGSFFKLTQDEYEFIMDMIRDENPLNMDVAPDIYTKDDFLSEVYMSEDNYDCLTDVLLNKKNIILQGAPGVGKTFCANRLAYSLMGEKNDSQIELIQFHQNYSYEDFMMGYKPNESGGFSLKTGVFYQFCQKAANQPDKKFFFIIDEINRGNLSRIFGELLMLIEKDYRGKKATLAYNGMAFTVPENLFIIGMMNTADRSLAMIDYALRRRFSFFEIEPGFDAKGFRDYKDTLDNETFDELIARVVELNEEIRRDQSLGKGFCIGHSYFCGKMKDTCTDRWMRAVVDYDILPMLSEYWFDDDDKVQRWEHILHGVFQ
ncbi:AAA family ATPase [uncultured Megasphaera sp.]|uniref:AAA family ATPase n=1 Tax=uncultured Megasphaera sp. TaxID=165188 RepID=UPI0025EF1D78|nr:AAA family ATPase [uncultured Megasphaera sp.]